jgi:hypothetical protein
MNRNTLVSTPSDLDPALAKVDLQLFARRTVARAAAINSRRNGATARSTVRRLIAHALLSSQLLAHHVGVARMAVKPLTHPIGL